MSSFTVIRPGLQTTIQDRGRWGWQSRGVSVAGAMDPYSCRVANALVGNDADAAALEMTFVGPELEFDDARIVAVAGAEFAITIDGTPAPVGAAFPVSGGSRLRFGDRAHGVRAYLAVAGGITVPRILGSRSTHLVSRMGGLAGRPLAAGDRVPLGDPMKARRVRLEVQLTEVELKRDPTIGPGAARVRVMPDARLDRFVDGALDVLQSAPYTVSRLSDRMGFRLEGPHLQHSHGADILSEITPLGTVQVPASGQPILLMADRQTTGGYARIATVISADIGVAGQRGPDDRLSFDVCTLGEALAARAAQERALLAIEEKART